LKASSKNERTSGMTFIITTFNILTFDGGVVNNLSKN